MTTVVFMIVFFFMTELMSVRYSGLVLMFMLIVGMTTQ